MMAKYTRNIVLLLTILLLSGCGFRPSFGINAIDPDVAEELASVSIAPLEDRQGQLVTNALETTLAPNGRAARMRYRLQITITITTGQLAVSSDRTSTRTSKNYSITYRLYEDKAAIAAGTFSQIHTINLLQQNYSNEIALEDIKQRAAEEIATEIRSRLAAYFAKARQVKDAGGIESGKEQANK